MNGVMELDMATPTKATSRVASTSSSPRTATKSFSFATDTQSSAFADGEEEQPPRHPWTASSRPQSLMHKFSVASRPVPPSPTLGRAFGCDSSDVAVQQFIKTKSLPFASHYMGRGYSRERHVKTNLSKTVCDLADARAPAFEGHSYGRDLYEQTSTYRRGRCDARPGSIGHPEWSPTQLQIPW